ncbi:MAG: hypothetical protein ACRYG6_10340 [Janthinobacterium lividum]
MSRDPNAGGNNDSHARSAKAQKADEVQAAGTAKAGGAHGEDFVPEGGVAPSPLHKKGEPMPAASRAAAEGNESAGTSSATVGKAEKEAAHQNAALTKTQDGRGHRKHD